jgi:hypothetical protein
MSSNVCPYWRRGYCVADKACKLEHDPNEGGQHQEAFLSQQRSQQSSSKPTTVTTTPYPVSAVSMASALYGGGQRVAYGYGYYAPVTPGIVGVIGQPGVTAAAPAPNKYKTVQCRHFIRGHCMRGALCGFRHGDDESSTAPPPSLGQLPAELANPLYPGRPFRVVTCRRWAQGNCTLGDRCTFKHDFENSTQYTTGTKRQLSGGGQEENTDPVAPNGTKVMKIASE